MKILHASSSVFTFNCEKKSTHSYSQVVKKRRLIATHRAAFSVSIWHTSGTHCIVVNVVKRLELGPIPYHTFTPTLCFLSATLPLRTKSQGVVVKLFPCEKGQPSRPWHVIGSCRSWHLCECKYAIFCCGDFSYMGYRQPSVVVRMLAILSHCTFSSS